MKTQKTSSLSKNNSNNYQPDKYRALIEKLLHLRPIDWPKFLEQWKKLHLTEIYQTETNTNLRKSTQKKYPYHYQKYLQKKIPN